MSTISKLKTLTSSDDFRVAIKTLEDEHRKLIDTRAELEGGREAAMFGNGDLDTFRSTTAKLDEQILDTTTALAGARKRHAEALNREATEALEQRAAEARAADKHLRAALKKWHGLAAPLAKLAHEIHVAEREIRNINRAVLDAGRKDLMVPSYLGELAGKRREIADRRRAKQGGLPPIRINPSMWFRRSLDFTLHIISSGRADRRQSPCSARPRILRTGTSRSITCRP